MLFLSLISVSITTPKFQGGSWDKPIIHTLYKIAWLSSALSEESSAIDWVSVELCGCSGTLQYTSSGCTSQALTLGHILLSINGHTWQISSIQGQQWPIKWHNVINPTTKVNVEHGYWRSTNGPKASLTCFVMSWCRTELSALRLDVCDEGFILRTVLTSPKRSPHLY